MNPTKQEIKAEIENNLMIGLFKATVEQQTMLLGIHKHQTKRLLNDWFKKGDMLLKHLHKVNDSIDGYEEVMDGVSDSIHEHVDDLRKEFNKKLEEGTLKYE